MTFTEYINILEMLSRLGKMILVCDFKEIEWLLVTERQVSSR